MKEVWNILIYCASAERDEISKIGSSHPSIKEQGAWIRELSSIKINEGMYEGIDGILQQRMKSQKSDQQPDWMIAEYPHRIEDSKKHEVTVCVGCSGANPSLE